ncbi:hypothetical protein DB346_20295 [Verrucomicrobia bacterium LW23]|nr:hypothetical protein DB346_20295 [Verrucomicrobia bacterium LW23]
MKAKCPYLIVGAVAALAALPLSSVHAADTTDSLSKDNAKKAEAEAASDSTEVKPSDSKEVKREKIIKQQARAEAEEAKQMASPMDQSEEAADLKVTQNIRNDVLKIEGLSLSGQNIKIITTKDKEVFLRGEVATRQELTNVINAAKKNTAGYVLKNELTVANQVPAEPKALGTSDPRNETAPAEPKP